MRSYSFYFMSLVIMFHFISMYFNSGDLKYLCFIELTICVSENATRATQALLDTIQIDELYGPFA